MKERIKENKKILDWIKKEKFILQSLINHHQANMFLLHHLNAYSISIKDYWNLLKVKRYIKKLDKLEKTLKNKNG